MCPDAEIYNPVAAHHPAQEHGQPFACRLRCVGDAIDAFKQCLHGSKRVFPGSGYGSFHVGVQGVYLVQPFADGIQVGIFEEAVESAVAVCLIFRVCPVRYERVWLPCHVGVYLFRLFQYLLPVAVCYPRGEQSGYFYVSFFREAVGKTHRVGGDEVFCVVLFFPIF